MLWLIILGSPAFADSIVGVATSRHQETITLSIETPDPHKVFLIQNPDRLVIDIPLLEGQQKAALPDKYDGKLLKSVRYGKFDSKTSRFVFDLAQPIKVVESHNEKDALVVTIAAADEKVEEAAPPEKPAKLAQPQKPTKPTKPTIIIDAGHGGIDPGTLGPGGTKEKNLTLDYAKALKARLLKSGKYNVKLTREDDTFIMLRKRVEIARKAHGDLFISLHADSVPDEDTRGLSIYTVSEKASDAESAALAAQENKADVLAGMDLSHEREDVAGILISLAERDTSNRSVTFADLVVTSLDGRVHLLPNTHRFAGFAVLKAPDIPSVLIEIGFLSNEEKLLKSKAYRDKVANLVGATVDAYFRAEKRLTQ